MPPIRLVFAVAIALASLAEAAKVLVFMPSLNYLTLVGGKQVRVGWYLDEFYWTAAALTNAGYDLDVVTPEGNSPPLDPASNSSHYFASEAEYLAAVSFVSTLQPLLYPRSLAQLITNFDVTAYAGVFVPGGHAPIIDLMPNAVVGSVLYEFFLANKYMGFICHGPLVSLSMILAPNNNASTFPFAGRNMTVFSQPEEGPKEKFWGAVIGYYPNILIGEHGGNMQIAAPFTANVIVDGNLITGQNPQSAELFSQVYVAHVNTVKDV